MEKFFQKYLDPAQPGAFSGLSGFLKNNSKLDKNLVAETLKQISPFTLHKPKRIHYRRIKVQVGGIDSQWQIDLIETQDIAGIILVHAIYLPVSMFSVKKLGHYA